MKLRTRHPAPEFGVLRLTLALAAFVAGAAFCFTSDSSWKSYPTFYYINQLPIPWWVYGILLVVAGCCLWFKKTRPIGYLIGAIVYCFFAIGAWLAVLGGFHLHILLLVGLNFPPATLTSLFAASNITTIAVLYLSAAKHSIYAQLEDPTHDTNYTLQQ